MTYFLCLLSFFGLFQLFFFKQKTAYEMRISDWSSDVCSSELCEIDPAVGCRERLVWHDVGVSVAITGRILPRGEKVKGLICKGGNGDIEQRHVEMSALAGISPPDKSCQDRDRRVETRQDRKSTRLNSSH